MKEERELTEHGLRAERALQEAIADAVEEHRRTGIPVVVQQNGEAVLVDPREVQTVRERRATYRSERDNA